MSGGHRVRAWLSVGVLGLLVAAGLSAPAALAARHSAGVQTKWSRYTYSGKRSGLLFVSGHMDVTPGSFFAIVDEINARASKPVVFGDVLDLDALEEFGTYGSLGNRDLCTGPARCLLHGGALTFSDEVDVGGNGHGHTDLRQYIVARGAHVVIHDVILAGWSASHRDGGALRRTDADAGGAGAVAFGTSAGVNLGVSAPGPAGGSVALAVPACDQIGAGVLTLTGGTARQTAVCPSDTIAAVARHRTTWQASGAVAGASNYTTRLLVIDA